MYPVTPFSLPLTVTIPLPAFDVNGRDIWTAPEAVPTVVIVAITWKKTRGPIVK